jgi:2-methylisocitrate lyase-like PEP mutase family enzyme
MSQPSHTAQLRQLLEQRLLDSRPILSVPGCWDGFTALLIEQAGFECAFLTGGGLSMARLGRPDLGLVTADELINTIAVIRDRVSIPLIVDADTGFGGVHNLQRTLRGCERAGATAVQIEDQAFPKRCGHMAGKQVVPLSEACERIHAAVDARQEMLVIARTDALALEGLASAMERAEAYLEAGADALFVEGPRSMDELQQVADRFGSRIPLIHNLVEGGVTPTEEGDTLNQLGFAIALHPLLLLHGFAHAAPEWLAHLRDNRSTTGIANNLATLPQINDITGLGSMLDRTFTRD